MDKDIFLIGITGGIGSGKSTVSAIFEKISIPVYYSDTRAKLIQNENEEVRKMIIALFGSDAYNNEGINKSYISNQIFNDQDKLKKLNGIVHPEVFSDFEIWKNEQHSSIIAKETAILIESGSYKDCDVVIGVFVELEKRIIRTMQRDKLKREDILARINNQISDQERKRFCDFVIDNNDDLKHLERQVMLTLNKIKTKFNLK